MVTLLCVEIHIKIRKRDFTLLEFIQYSAAVAIRPRD